MSSFSSGTYATYKAGTSKVYNWLYENALKCGYSGQEDKEDARILEKTSNSKPNKKVNSHQGKVKGSGKLKSKKPTITPPKKGGVKEFIALAEAITSSEGPKIEVPLWVTSVVQQVIKGRKKAAKFFSRQSGDTASNDVSESNQAHQYFIEILEHVLDLLHTYSGHKTSPNTPNIKSSNDDPLAQVTNLFDLLEIEADTEHTMTEKSSAVPAPVTYYEEEPSEGEIVWLIYCFFEDFNIARVLLKNLWTAYKRGAIDLSAVALITNTEFEMFQRAEKDLKTQLRLTIPPDLLSEFMDDGYIRIQTFLYFVVADRTGQTPGKICPADPYNYALYDIADWTCFPVYILLHSFVNVIKPDVVPICKPGHIGKLNLRGDVLSPQEKCKQDETVLLEHFLPELMLIADFKDPTTKKPLKFPGQDELTKGILNMVRSKDVPIWLVLSVQVQLDIHYVLLSDTGRAKNELATYTKQMSTTLKEYLEFSKTMSIDNWPKQNDRVLQNVLLEYEMWISKDFLNPIRQQLFGQVGCTGENRDTSFALLKRHPVLCGMALFRFSVIMQDLGMTLANAWGVLPTVLHLYNAAVSERALNALWLDLEAIIIANSPQRIFIGRRPDMAQDYLKQFMLAMGWSETVFSANSRHGIGGSRRPASKKSPLQMIAPSPLIKLYRDRYFNNGIWGKSKSSELTLIAIENLLIESIGTSSTSVDASSHGAAVKSEDCLMTGRSDVKNMKRDQDGRSKKFAKSRKLTTIQLLKALEESIVPESFALNVDYFALHMRAYRFLRAIAHEMDSTFVKYFGPAYIEKETQLPFLVGSIFQVMAGASKVAQTQIPGMTEEQIGFKILADASVIMARFIDEEGTVEIEKVKRKCVNFDGIEVVLTVNNVV